METWLITLICAIISAVISLTLSYFTNRYNYRHLFAEQYLKVELVIANYSYNLYNLIYENVTEK